MVRPTTSLGKPTIVQFWQMFLCAIFPIACAGGFFWLFTLAYLMVTKLHMNDFGKFYYSIVAFIEGGDMYEPNPATLMQTGPLLAQHFWNLNPPHFHFPFIPLGLLPPMVALGFWTIISLASLVWSFHCIGQELRLAPTKGQKRLVFLGILSFTGTGSLVLTGQVSLLLLLPITLAWISARRSRWNNSAMYLGFLASVKPFFLIFALLFMFKRQYRALLLFLVSFVIPFVIGLVTFGVPAYQAWVHVAGSIDWEWVPMNASLLGFLSRTLAENPLYSLTLNASNLITPLWVLGTGLILVFTSLVIIYDPSEHAIDRGFSLLMLAALLISPLGWTYYFFFLFGPLTALLKTGWQDYHTSLPRISPATRRICSLLIFISFLGVFWPLPASFAFQPHPSATFFLGSMYFWSLLSIWLVLLFDWHSRCFDLNQISTEHQSLPHTY